jgi:hypothetical protein
MKAHSQSEESRTVLVVDDDADTISVQSKEQTVDGKAIPDTKETKMQRAM